MGSPGDGVFYALAVVREGNRLPAVARGVRGGAIRPAGLIHRLREGSPGWANTRLILTAVATLTGMGAGLRLLLPEVWAGQCRSPWWSWVAAFLVISLVNCFVEYLSHRYVWHPPAIAFVRRLYRQQTLHHALTRKESRDGRGILLIENKFPIVEPEQDEASFFPWYSLAVFAVVLSPLLALFQWLVPTWPWVLAGLAAPATDSRARSLGRERRAAASRATARRGEAPCTERRRSGHRSRSGCGGEWPGSHAG